MKYSFSIVLILLAYLSYGQCKYINNEIDEFTGEKKVITKTSYVRGKANEQPFGFYLAKIDTTSFMVFEVFTTSLDYVDTDSEINFLFDDKTKLTVKHVGKAKSSDTHHHSWSNKFWAYLDDEAQNQLKKKTINKVRFHLKNSYKDHTVNKKNKTKIPKMIVCI